MKILNLYAGIGGNRKLWGNEHEITAVENVPEIAKIYQDFFPNDKVIIADAHQYLLDHYKEFDFIWSSPPCPTHSTMRNLKNNCDECEKKYPDMKLYEEIIFLSHFYKGKFVVENVISYYEPLIKPFICANHYFWSNFNIGKLKVIDRGIRTMSVEEKEKDRGIKFDETLPEIFRNKLLNNCVFPEVGLHVFNCAFRIRQEVLI